MHHEELPALPVLELPYEFDDRDASIEYVVASFVQPGLSHRANHESLQCSPWSGIWRRRIGGRRR